MIRKRTIVLLILLLALLPLAYYCLPESKGSLRIIFTCDARGRLEPCGCYEGQMGGLTRIDTLMRYDGSLGDIRLDVGDAIGGNKDYHIIHHRNMLKAFKLMEYDALNVGAREAQLTSDQLRQIKEASEVPYVSANIVDADTKQTLFEPYVIIRHSLLKKVAIIGVLDPDSSPMGFGKGVLVEDMFTTLHKLIPEVKKKADVIILLAFADEQQLSKLAKEFYEADVILGGDVAQPSQEMITENRSIILYVTNQARSLGTLNADIGSDGRLEPLSYDIRLVHYQIPESPRIKALAEAYRTDIRDVTLDIDKKEYRHADSVPGISKQASYSGTDACTPCHEKEHKVWQKTAHSSAFGPLTRTHADADPNCIGCHTVGFGRPDGYRREYGDSKLVNVGCESCHGPGSLHISKMKKESDNNFKFRKLGAGDCIKCHHGEYSRPFDMDTFWRYVKH